MGIFDVFKKQFIDVIEWNEDESDLISFRYPIIDNEIPSFHVISENTLVFVSPNIVV